MSLKITVKSKEKKKAVDGIKPGMVFQYNDGPKCLKLHNDAVVLLTYSDGSDWFELNDDKSFREKDIQVLGYLNEIIVVE